MKHTYQRKTVQVGVAPQDAFHIAILVVGHCEPKDGTSFHENSLNEYWRHIWVFQCFQGTQCLQ